MSFTAVYFVIYVIWHLRECNLQCIADRDDVDEIHCLYVPQIITINIRDYRTFVIKDLL